MKTIDKAINRDFKDAIEKMRKLTSDVNTDLMMEWYKRGGK